MLPQPMIAVHEVAATSAWYQAALGFTSGHGGAEYEQLMSEGQLVMQLHHWDAHEHPHLGNPASKPHGNGVVLWFLSQEVEAAYQRAQRAAAEVLQPLGVNPLANHLEFWLRDPNGYVVVVAGPFGQLGSFGQNAA